MIKAAMHFNRHQLGVYIYPGRAHSPNGLRQRREVCSSKQYMALWIGRQFDGGAQQELMVSRLQLLPIPGVLLQ